VLIPGRLLCGRRGGPACRRSARSGSFGTSQQAQHDSRCRGLSSASHHEERGPSNLGPSCRSTADGVTREHAHAPVIQTNNQGPPASHFGLRPEVEITEFAIRAWGGQLLPAEWHPPWWSSSEKASPDRIRFHPHGPILSWSEASLSTAAQIVLDSTVHPHEALDSAQFRGSMSIGISLSSGYRWRGRRVDCYCPGELARP